MNFARQSANRKKTRISMNGAKSLTEQQHKADCDIHNIMRKYKQTGVITHVNQYEGSYMDLPTDLDYHTAQNIIADAASMFETVPSHIRKDFDNDPSKFLAFMQDSKNAEQISKYGLSNAHFNPDPTLTPTPKAKTPETPPESPSSDTPKED